MKDGMHMITACFARVSLRCTRRTSMPFLLIIQGVRPTSKTRNQLYFYEMGSHMAEELRLLSQY
jgi:hypothetical protein